MERIIVKTSLWIPNFTKSGWSSTLMDKLLNGRPFWWLLSFQIKGILTLKSLFSSCHEKLLNNILVSIIFIDDFRQILRSHVNIHQHISSLRVFLFLGVFCVGQWSSSKRLNFSDVTSTRVNFLGDFFDCGDQWRMMMMRLFLFQMSMLLSYAKLFSGQLTIRFWVVTNILFVALRLLRLFKVT